MTKIQTMLLDPSIPMDHRRELLGQLAVDDNPTAAKILGGILEAAAAGKSESIYKTKTQELDEKLKQMEQGPLRAATFVRMTRTEEPVQRAAVLLEDGTTACVSVPDAKLAASLRCGETVLLEAQAKAVLFRDTLWPTAGEEARLERVLADGRIEITVRDLERYVYRAASTLEEKLASGEAAPGCTVLICSRRLIAFEALAPADGPSHYRFLSHDPVPDVVLERDVGAPPPWVAEAVETLRMEMLQPELCRGWGKRRSTFKMLSGVSGTGKSLSVLAFWNRMYAVMSEVTGVAVEDLPPRVMRLRPASTLSKWFGEAEKSLDRFVDEILLLADERFVTPDGRRVVLPLLIIAEEADGMARRRGDEPIYDRVLSTILERLDTTRNELANKLIFFLATTNVEQYVDPAFLRRVGGTVERFGRLRRPAFVAVLDKLMRRHPVVANGDVEAARRTLVGDVTGWLYGPEHDGRGLVELTFAGSTTPVVKRGRDFLTPSLIDRAVQQAVHNGCRAAARGSGVRGLTGEALISTLEQQIHAVVDQLHESNVHQYVDLPDGVRVAGLRRIERPSIQPFQLETVSVGEDRCAK